MVEGMHVIKNLGDTVCDSLMGADVNQKVRNHWEARNIRREMWAEGLPNLRPSEYMCI
jgi:hypothetical protein